MKDRFSKQIYSWIQAKNSEERAYIMARIDWDGITGFVEAEMSKYKVKILDQLQNTIKKGGE